MKENLESSDEISVRDIVLRLKKGIRAIKLKWKVILFWGLLGAVLGLTYAIVQKPTYLAVSTFVLEDGSKSAGLGQYGELASIAGIDVNVGGSSIFQGDNIIELYKSRIMLEKALLSEIIIDGQKLLLIDRYINFNKLRRTWKTKDYIDSISFRGSPDKFSRVQDSIISNIVNVFNTKFLTVYKLDKKSGIIVVQFVNEDELFAKEFNIKLVETVNNFYATTKTKKSNQNVNVLQHQADSVKGFLNNAMNGVASGIDAIPNANPQLSILKVPSQKKQVDVQASTVIYSEIIKNLELSKMSLRQDKPLIQIIDEPVLPLMISKVGKVKGAILGITVSITVMISFYILRKMRKILSCF